MCPLQLFPASGLLEFAVIDILGPVLKTVNRNQIELVMNDCYLILVKAVLTFIRTALLIQSFSWTNWLILMDFLSTSVLLNFKNIPKAWDNLTPWGRENGEFPLGSLWRQFLIFWDLKQWNTFTFWIAACFTDFWNETNFSNTHSYSWRSQSLNAKRSSIKIEIFVDVAFCKPFTKILQT